MPFERECSKTAPPNPHDPAEPVSRANRQSHGPAEAGRQGAKFGFARGYCMKVADNDRGRAFKTNPKTMGIID